MEQKFSVFRLFLYLLGCDGLKKNSYITYLKYKYYYFYCYINLHVVKHIHYEIFIAVSQFNISTSFPQLHSFCGIPTRNILI